MPVPDFDTSRCLTPLERAAALACLRADGADKMLRDYATLVAFVTHLSLQGVTRVEIHDLIMGDLWDNVQLMKRGQKVRNDTILLTRAMLIQTIAERG